MLRKLDLKSGVHEKHHSAERGGIWGTLYFHPFDTLGFTSAKLPTHVKPIVSMWAQLAGGFLALEAGIYAWHRTMHNTPFLWRWFHQMHHSAERVDIWGALYFHPFDTLGFTFVGSLALVLGFGVSAEAAILINYAATFMGLFQHANIRTPRWLGYLIQRPESHSCHHERGIHARNYGDLPVFDMIFGTFHNPKEFTGEVGFFDGSSRKVGPMLIGKVIS